MKKILIIGLNSYIGDSFSNFLNQWPDLYQVDAVGTIENEWQTSSFVGYDAIYHVAGIAHQKENKDNCKVYDEINRKLSIAVAEKAKVEGVRQFVFMSSMSVYGMDTGVITSETVPHPKTYYGTSKLQAEDALKKLESDTFKITIIRAPMVYGKGCKGNFNSVREYVKSFPIFPKVSNKRSLIYIDNLCSFIKKTIDKELSGTFYPQNKEYVNTTEMARWISEVMQKKIRFSSILGLGTKMISPFIGKARKAFGTLIYKDLEIFDFDYCIVNNEDSIKRSI